MVNDTIQGYKKSLLDSNWPKCNDLALSIASFKNQEAKKALIEALNNGKRHHIRTAALKALIQYNEPEVIKQIKRHLTDPAYETRTEAKKILKDLTGEEF